MRRGNKNLIIWVEDRPETVAREIAFCKEQGLEVQLVGTVSNLSEHLYASRERIVLIVLDCMLYGVPDLDSIGIKNAPTDNGRNAGWVIIDRFLRDNEYGRDYKAIPILIFTIRELRDTDKLQSMRERGGRIEYIEKCSINEKGSTCIEQFREILPGIMNER